MITNEAPVTPIIRIAKIDTCPSISGLSELTFHIGYEADNQQQLCLRLVHNTGNGKIHPGWLYLADIEKALASVPVDGAFKASVLKPLFAGRSTNNLHFTLACLLHCGLLKKADPSEDGYVRHTAPEWWQEISALIAAKTALPDPSMAPSADTKDSAPAKPVKSAKKAAVPA